MSLGFIQSEGTFYWCWMLVYVQHVISRDCYELKWVPNAYRPCDLLLSSAKMSTFKHPYLLRFVNTIFFMFC